MLAASGRAGHGVRPGARSLPEAIEVGMLQSAAARVRSPLASRSMRGHAPRAVRLEPLESRVLLSAVTARSVLYNHSAFDGNDPAADARDAAAVAPDKTALLPGQTATFANYTSYTRGINGIMVDVVGLAGRPVTAADFVFRVG